MPQPHPTQPSREMRDSNVDPSSSEPLTPPRDPFVVLGVDPEPEAHRVLQQYAHPQAEVTVLQAGSFARAERILKAQRVDLALIEPVLPDGSGLELVDRLNRGRGARAVMITREPDPDQLIRAMRAGAVDVLARPLTLTRVAPRLDEQRRRLRRDRATARRVRQLRSTCRELREARDVIADEVNVLCRDLVTGYRELADQVHHAADAAEYHARVGRELDLGALVRHTMEYLIDKAGPTNAAVFLPAAADEYSIGGWVNYTMNQEAADFLLEHLADTLVTRVADRNGPVHLDDQPSRRQWLGTDGLGLAETQVVAMPARAPGGETLGVIVLFRHESEPFDATLVETCRQIGPAMGERLAKIIHIHHRHAA